MRRSVLVGSIQISISEVMLSNPGVFPFFSFVMALLTSRVDIGSVLKEREVSESGLRSDGGRGELVARGVVFPTRVKNRVVSRNE